MQYDVVATINVNDESRGMTECLRNSMSEKQGNEMDKKTMNLKAWQSKTSVSAFFQTVLKMLMAPCLPPNLVATRLPLRQA